ncbi:MAG: tetratricopeptide repeat protein [Bacteroides sp.]|nr:tetratricopeptide repeat protein [Bacteroides sp.]
MKRKKYLSGRDKELCDMAEKYEAAIKENKPLYMDADDLADLADWYATRGKFPTAIEIVEYGLKLHPNNTELLVEQAYLYIDTRNHEKAKAIIEQIDDKFSSEVKILRAYVLLDEGQPEEVEWLLDTLEDKDALPNLIEIAYMYNDKGYSEKALEWIRRGEGLYDNEEAYMATYGDCYYSDGQIEKAAEIYNQLIDRNPYSASYWYALARCYNEQRQPDKAIEACDYALVADDEFAEAYVMKGNCYYMLGNTEAATECFQQAVKQNLFKPDIVSTFTALSKVSEGKWQEALDCIEIALDQDPSDYETVALLYANAALCLHHLGRDEEAHENCDIAHDINPDDAEVDLIEGRIYMEEDNIDRAIDCWEDALDKAPYPDTWYEIGVSCLETGRMEHARTAFERVKELDPDYEGINEKLTSLYIVLRDKENFKKYNKLCAHPLTPKDLNRILPNDNDNDIIKAIKDFFGDIE